MPLERVDQNRYKKIRHILTNGYSPKEKLTKLEELGISPQSIHGQSQEEFYNATFRNLIHKYGD